MVAKMEWGLRGVIVPLVTPFHDDMSMSIDWDGLRCLVDFYIEDFGCDGLVPCGTTGESPTLSHQEHEDVIRVVTEHTAGRVPVIAGAGSNSTREAVALTQAAKAAGVDATLQVCPYYNKPSQDGIFNHFRAIGEAVDLPMILYNIPGRTGRNIDPSTIVRLSENVPQVVGLKDASGDLQQAMLVLRGTDRDSFQVYSGEDIMTFALLCHGGAGAIAAVAHVVGREVKEMCTAVWSGNLERARELHFLTMPVVDALFIEPNPTPVKQALEWMGLPAGPLRPPLERMTERGQAILRAAMETGGWI
ncbi:MAG: 4-hydroxy-tetrahydrodipicolinate synthase [Thermoleophilia bacterium]